MVLTQTNETKPHYLMWWIKNGTFNRNLNKLQFCDEPNGVPLSAQKRRKPLRYVFCWQWPRVNPRRVDTKPYRVWASRPPVLRDMNFTLGGFARARHFWRMIAAVVITHVNGSSFTLRWKELEEASKQKKISLLTLSTSRRWPSPCWARQSSWSGRSTSGNLRRWRKTNVSVMVRKWISILQKWVNDELR